MSRRPYLVLRIRAERADREAMTAALVLETEHGKLAGYLDTTPTRSESDTLADVSTLFRLPGSAFAFHEREMRVRSREFRAYRRLAGFRGLLAQPEEVAR